VEGKCQISGGFFSFNILCEPISVVSPFSSDTDNPCTQPTVTVCATLRRTEIDAHVD